MHGLYSWVKRLLARMAREASTPAAPFALPPVEPWTDSDRDNLLKFLNGTTGAKLCKRLHAMRAHLAISGAAELMHTQHSAGVTHGYGEALKHLFSLTAASEQRQVIPVKQASPYEEYVERLSA